MQDSKTKYWHYAQEVNGQVNLLSYLGRVNQDCWIVQRSRDAPFQNCQGELAQKPSDSTTYNPENSTAMDSGGR